MGRPLICAADVAQIPAGGTLHVPDGAIVTPLARDAARDKGVTIVSEAKPAPQSGGLAAEVRSIVERLLAGSGSGTTTPAPRAAVKHATFSDAPLERFGYPGPPPGMDVFTGDVVTAADGPMAAGYMTITKGEFPWTLNYDEVQIVLEGELHLGGDAGGKVGRAGDVLYVPKGSSITFGTPSWAKFVYVTFPANWEDA